MIDFFYGIWNTVIGSFGNFNWVEIASGFIVLFAIIDVTGSVPIFLNLKSQNKIIEPFKVAAYSFLILLFFLFVGEWVLRLFHVDISSFAIAGALIILIIAAEMIFGIEVFKYDGNESGGNSATLVPVVFPLITGPGTFTTLLSMRAEFSVINIVVALAFNMLLVYLVIRFVGFVKKLIGIAGVYILRKFFGVVLMAIAVRLITSNLSALMELVKDSSM